MKTFSHLLLFMLTFNDGAGVQPLSCGQTNECLSIVGEVRVELRVVPRTQQQKFEAITDGLCWRVRITESAPPKDGPPFWQEFGSDGQSVYAVTYYDTNYTGPSLFAGRDGLITTNTTHRRSRNNASAKVIPGTIPMPVSLIEYIWLASLSGCELKHLEANAVSGLPALYAGGSETDHITLREPARWVLSREFPFTPSRFEFFGGGTYGFSEEKGTHRIIPSQPFTNLALTVESTTNSGAWTVPAKFSFNAFRAPSSSDPGTSAVVFSGRGNTIAITKVPRPNSFLPLVSSSTSVQDWRLNADRATTYYASNRWFTPEEVKRRGQH